MLEYDAKGKIFSLRVQKQAVPVTIQTVTHKIRGQFYLRPKSRVKDELEEAEQQFLALTDAEVYGPDGAALFHSDFLTVNRDHIVWLLLEEEPEAEQFDLPE